MSFRALQIASFPAFFISDAAQSENVCEANSHLYFR